MRTSEFWRLIKETAVAWNNDSTLMLGAALAFYAVFSISPLLIITLSITGFFYKGEGAGYIEAEMAGLMGDDAAKVIAGTIHSVNQSDNGLAATIFSVIALFIGASGVFVQLQESMNRIWGVTPKPGHFVRDFLKQRVASFAMVVGMSFLLLVSLLVSAALAALTGYLNYLLPAATAAWQAGDILLSFGVVVVVFAAIFKIVPDVRIDWSDVWIGALVTGILFTLGKSLIGTYLGRSDIGSAYGAAGSILVILAWVYYTSQVMFFGAEFTKVYAEHHRVAVRAVKGAKAVTEDAQLRESGQTGCIDRG